MPRVVIYVVFRHCERICQNPRGNPQSKNHKTTKKRYLVSLDL